MANDAAQRRIVVFDLGGVLLQWDPRHLYRKLFADEQAMEAFLAEVCTVQWNERQDAGRTFAEAVAELMPQHEDKRELIEAFGSRFGEMIPGAIEGERTRGGGPWHPRHSLPIAGALASRAPRTQPPLRRPW